MLTGQVLDLELETDTLNSVIKSSLRELQRYITATKTLTIPFTTCIDLNTVKDSSGNFIRVSTLVKVFRTSGYVRPDSDSAFGDPMQLAQWQLITGAGNMRGFQDYAYNYAAWNTLLQIRNTASTDLAFMYNKQSNKLYINLSTDYPDQITIEYIPIFNDPSEINSDYWTDVLVRYSCAKTKVVVGRIRSRYKQQNSIWSQDGDQLLQEGTSELDELRHTLSENTALFYSAID